MHYKTWHDREVELDRLNQELERTIAWLVRSGQFAPALPEYEAAQRMVRRLLIQRGSHGEFRSLADRIPRLVHDGPRGTAPAWLLELEPMQQSLFASVDELRLPGTTHSAMDDLRSAATELDEEIRAGKWAHVIGRRRVPSECRELIAELQKRCPGYAPKYYASMLASAPRESRPTNARSYCNGRLGIALAPWEAKMSHWINSPVISDLATGAIVLDLGAEPWDLIEVADSGSAADLLLRKYPGSGPNVVLRVEVASMRFRLDSVPMGPQDLLIALDEHA
jgi:hypothetical protein